MKNIFEDSEIMWACVRYCEGKDQLNEEFFKGVWNYFIFRNNISDKQREAVLKFIKKEKIDVKKWSNDEGR